MATKKDLADLSQYRELSGAKPKSCCPVVLGFDTSTLSLAAAAVEYEEPYRVMWVGQKPIDRPHMGWREMQVREAMAEFSHALEVGGLSPVLVAIEKPWLGNNANTLMVLSVVVGMVTVESSRRWDCKVETVNPNTWRGHLRLATRPRHVAKADALGWAHSVWPHALTEDIADAIGVAVYANDVSVES